MQKNVERLLWLCAGVAIGAGVALLYAPQSGQETRKYLSKRAGEARDKVVEIGEDLADTGRAAYAKGAKVVEDTGNLLARGRKWVTG